MRVFISYSTGDLDLVRRVAGEVEHSAEVKYWDKDKKPGERAWATIFGWIDSCDLVIVLITDKAVRRGLAIGKEIGRGEAKGKTIIPLVDKNVPESELGCLNGRTFVRLDRDNPGAAMLEVGEVLKERAVALATAERAEAKRSPKKAVVSGVKKKAKKRAVPAGEPDLLGVLAVVGAVLLVVWAATSK